MNEPAVFVLQDHRAPAGWTLGAESLATGSLKWFYGVLLDAIGSSCCLFNVATVLASNARAASWAANALRIVRVRC